MRGAYWLMLCVLLLGACSGRNYQGPAGTEIPGKPTIFVGIMKGASSPFKEKLVTQLMRSYADSCNVIARQIRGYKDLQDNDYQAVIVMDRLKAWLLFNRPLKKIADRMDKQKHIYFISTGDPDWRWKREDIKLVTSATESADVSDVLKRIRYLLDTVLYGI
jgi:hypothetical protein